MLLPVGCVGALLAALLGCSNTTVEPASPVSKDRPAAPFGDFDQVMTYFYLAPSADNFATFQRRADALQAELKNSSKAAPTIVAVMIAEISRKHGWPIADTAFGSVAKEILEGKTDFAKFVSDDAAVDPLKLDIWWASFSATGEDRFLEKIFAHVGIAYPEDELERSVTIKAASWSFASNCRQHEPVLAFAKRKLQSSTVSKDQARFLEGCIEIAEAKRRAETDGAAE